MPDFARFPQTTENCPNPSLFRGPEAKALLPVTSGRAARHEEQPGILLAHLGASPARQKGACRLPVVMAAAAEPAVLLLLLQAGSGRAAEVFALLFGLL